RRKLQTMDNVIRRQSEQLDNNYNDKSDSDANYDYRKWEWGYLRTECQNLGLESLYITYVMRLQRSYLSIFLVIHTLIAIVHTVVLVATQQDNVPISPEVYCYLASILIVWISLTATFKEDLVRRHTWLPYVASCIAVIGLVLTDIVIPLYHTTVTQPKQDLRPGYASYILFAIYIFLPLSDNIHCTILAAATTICYLIEIFGVTYRNVDNMIVKSFTEFVFLVGVNLLGFYFRLMNEVAIRRAFLDRRECVEGNLLLKFERDQEKDLLLSILPTHIAGAIEIDIRRMIERIRLEKRLAVEQGHNSKNSTDTQLSVKTWRGEHIHKLYVEHHTGVSVLYADVVNYTHMTTQLPVKVLVETLHELFVKFDQASEEFNVLRIKFLGDCYYGVSGVPVRNPDHAKSCVNLGLRMIKDIRDVRAQKNNLNIDMRIGVHSGSIMSGVIGACKWQYDIWSKDAQIANKLESTGVPGKVHITKQTLDMLDGKYICDIGTEKAAQDPFLRKNGITTFLISPQYSTEYNYYIPDDNNNNRRCSFGVKRLIQARSSNLTTTLFGSRASRFTSSIEI
ncbi:Adenylyl cyclase X E, partial [Pseudolycoriella hygida]